MKVSSRVFALFLAVFAVFPVFGQEYLYEQFTEQDGLPSMTTYEILQDSSGILWFGTENGLVSYDGVEFTPHIYPELKDNDILELFIHDGKYIGFVNDSKEFGLIKGDSLFISNFEKSVSNSEIFNVGSKNYIFDRYLKKNQKIDNIFGELKFENNQFSIESNFLKINGKKIEQILYTQFSRPIISKLDADLKPLLNSKSNNYNKKLAQVSIVFEMPDRNWDLLYHYINNEKDHYLTNRSGYYFKIDEEFNRLVKINDLVYFTQIGDEYFYSNLGVLEKYNIRTKEITRINDRFYFHYIYLDNEGTIWASTANSGLIKISQNNIISITNNDVSKGTLNIDANTKNLLVISENKITLLDTNLQTIKTTENVFKKPGSIISTDTGFYLGSDKRVLEVYKNSFLEPKTYFASGYIKSLYKYADSIYIGTINGMVVQHKTSTDNKKRPNIALNKSIYEIKYWKSEDVFILGTTTGLFILNSGLELTSFCKELKNTSINKIQIVNDSTLYVATKNKGIHKLIHEDIISTFDKDFGLLSNNINSFLLDDNYLFASTTNGISRIDLDSDSVKTLNSSNGLWANNITNIVLFNGKYLANVEGRIAILKNSDFDKENQPPKINLDKFYINNIQVQYENNINFSYNQNKIDIYLKNVALSSGKDKKVEYRIPEVDTNWVSTTDQIIRLPALEPGNYNVEALGINALGIKSKLLNLSFTISPPWWQTTWARILAVLGIIGLMTIIINYRNRQTLKKETVKRKYLTQINQIKEQALQLQMNPHFIFNSLNAIQNFIGTDDEQLAMNFLARFARLIRLIFEYSKGTKITLEEEIEFMKLYLDLEKLRFKGKVDIELNVDNDVEENFDIISVPPLLIQPIVENSFKHGLFHKKGKGKLRIDYCINEKIITVTIEDNGIGRKAAALIPDKDAEMRTSSGINTTNERLALLNYNRKDNHNKILIEDLMDQDGIPSGTRTTITLTSD